MQLGLETARREVDRTFQTLDHNASSYVCSEKLLTWYFSPANADLRAISLRLKSRTVANQGPCTVKHSVILDQVEAQVNELITLLAFKNKKEKRALKKVGSVQNVLLNRLVSRLHGIHDFMVAINTVDTNGNPYSPYLITSKPSHKHSLVRCGYLYCLLLLVIFVNHSTQHTLHSTHHTTHNTQHIYLSELNRQ